MPDGGAGQWGAPDSVSSTVPSVPKDDSISAAPGDAASTVPRISTGVAPGFAPSSAPNGATSTASRVLPGAASCRAPCYPLHGENDAFPTGCSVRRSSRQQMQRSVYDAATGAYVTPASR